MVNLNSYPSEIIPKSNYIADISVSTSDSKLAFIRRYDSIESLYDTDAKLIIEKVVEPTKDIGENRGVSMNLLGQFKPEYIKFKVKETHKNLHLRWKPGKRVVPAKNIPHDIVNCTHLFFRLNVLHNAPINLSDLGLENFPTGNGAGWFLHYPTFANYWHFILLIKKSDGKFISVEEIDKLKKLKNAIKQWLRVYLVQAVQKNTPEYEAISSERFVTDRISFYQRVINIFK